jgi:hypothetical protein
VNDVKLFQGVVGTVTVVVGWFAGHMLKNRAKCYTYLELLCKTTWWVASWRRAMCMLHLSCMEFDVVTVIRLPDIILCSVDRAAISV